MGESLDQTQFDEGQRREFYQRLRQETLHLKKLFESREFEYSDQINLGLEVEAWLADCDGLPTPSNVEFLNQCDDKDVVEEISKYNFELNTDPLPLGKGCLTQFHKNLAKTWELCREVSEKMQLNPILIGIHPLIRDQMLQPEYMSEGNRYKVLNDQIFELRQHQPIDMDIKGKEHFKLRLEHILIEAAATSIQVHLQANQENFRRVFNASLISSIPAVALAANSPYLYGHDLWDETRIPLFEQAVSLKQFRDKKGEAIGRVTFGTGYIRQTPLELFLENLDGYVPLIPVLFDEPVENLHHLCFHNGTLWRWNRPIIGKSSGGNFHLRVEQRAMASGPSLIDVVANSAFSIGLTQYYADHDKVPEESMTFTDCRNNFYQAAKNGLSAKVRWFGKEQALDQLILDELVPNAALGLLNHGVSQEEVNLYIHEIIAPRVRKGQNGARWQRSFIQCHGRDFQSLAKAYQANQFSGKPVHQWQL